MLKDFFKGNEENKDKKKQLENIVVFIIILIVTVLIINSMWSENKKEENTNSVDSSKVTLETPVPRLSIWDFKEAKSETTVLICSCKLLMSSS